MNATNLQECNYVIAKSEITVTVRRNYIQFEGLTDDDDEDIDAKAAAHEWADTVTERLNEAGYYHGSGGKLGYGRDTTSCKVFAVVRGCPFWPTRTHYDPTPICYQPDLDEALDDWAQEAEDGHATFDRETARQAILAAAHAALMAAQTADD